MEPTFRGVFLTSEHPEATARFYKDVALLPLEAVGMKGEYIYWRLERDGIQLAIHDAKAFAKYTYPPSAGSNLTHLYFKMIKGRFALTWTGLAFRPGPSTMSC